MKVTVLKSIGSKFFNQVFFVCVVTLLFSKTMVGQTTIFSENIGTPSGTTAIASNTYQTSLTFSGTGDVRNTSGSTGYTGSSSGGNVFLNGVGETFQIASIVTTGYTGLSLSFGVVKSTLASSMSELTLEYSTDGSAYTSVSLPAQATGTGTAIWRLVTVSLPVGAEGAGNLRLRWTTSTASPDFRLDDISLTGTATSCTPPTTQATSFSVNTVTSSSMNIAFTRGNGTGGVLVVARSGVAVNADPTSGTNYTASSTFGSGTQIGTGNYVVYKGTASGASAASGNITVSGLSASTTYHYAVYEYNTTSTCFNLTELTGNQTTLSVVSSSATDYFRSLGTGNWNTAGSWQSSADNSTWQTSTLVPTSSATSITVQTGHTITINANVTASSITIAGTGSLTFDGVAARALTVTGDLTISASGGSFITQPSGTFTNTMSIAGNISNAGTFDMSRGGTTLVCTVTFNRNGNQTVSGAGATTRFSYVVVNMGTSNSNILEISSSNFQACANFLHSNSSAANQLQNGTIKFSGSYTFSNALFQQGGFYEIVATAGVWLNNANVTTTAIDDSYDLRGLLRITSGTFNVGTASGNSIKYFTGSVITIEGGALNVSGRLNCNTTTQSTTCTISGGTITLIKVGSSSASSKFAGFQMTANSTFVWSGGTIVFQQGQAFYGGMDYSDVSTNATITGGTLQIANTSSAGGVQEFYIYTINPIPALNITTTNSPTVFLFSNLTVVGDITIAANATLDVQADPNAYAYEVSYPGATVYVATATYTISLKGNWSNSGTYTARDKTVTFNGITAQSLSGSSTTSFFNLTMNNASTTGLTFSKSAIVTGALTLTDGNIYTTSSFILTMNAGSSSSPGSADSFVDGPMKKIGNTDFVFPLGNGSYWRRVGISSLSASETFTAQYFHSSYSNVSNIKNETNPLTWVSDNEYWTLTRAGVIDAVVELYWENATTSNVLNCEDLRIAHWDNTNNYWEKANVDAVSTTGSCSGTNSGTIYSNADLVEFSPFTFGDITLVALPVSLVSFDAKLNGRKVDLTWTTVSEVNNDYFTIEKTKDGINYEFVAQVDGAGSYNGTLNYSVVDEHPFDGTSYYRLTQTDFDGHQQSFDLRTISFNNGSISSVYPNPVIAGGEVVIHFTDIKNTQVRVCIKDILGNECFTDELIVSKENEKLSFVLPANISPGIYFVCSKIGETYFTEKLTVR